MFNSFLLSAAEEQGSLIDSADSDGALKTLRTASGSCERTETYTSIRARVIKDSTGPVGLSIACGESVLAPLFSPVLVLACTLLKVPCFCSKTVDSNEALIFLAFHQITYNVDMSGP
jgi:hypothetical protein